ncbi:hypothetical protein ACFE04_018562 [Oxalis oulophora]
MDYIGHSIDLYFLGPDGESPVTIPRVALSHLIWHFNSSSKPLGVVGAIAAGNSVVLKPSEIAPATSSLLVKLFDEYLDASLVKVIEGSVAKTTALLEHRGTKYSTEHLFIVSEYLLKLAETIIAKSKLVHDTIALLSLDKVTYTNVILPLTKLDGQQFPLVQSCLFPKLVCTSQAVCKASGEAQRMIDTHVLSCRLKIYKLDGLEQTRSKS